MIKKLSRKIGFTSTEIRVLLFLSIIFLIGLVYKNFIQNKPGIEYRTFDYSEEDSSFNYYKNKILEDLPEEKHQKIKLILNQKFYNLPNLIIVKLN